MREVLPPDVVALATDAYDAVAAIEKVARDHPGAENDMGRPRAIEAQYHEAEARRAKFGAAVDLLLSDRAGLVAARPAGAGESGAESDADAVEPPS